MKHKLTQTALACCGALLSVFFLLFLLNTSSSEALGQNDNSDKIYDIVLPGGRVIDPETGLDAVRNVGIKSGSIEAISTAPLRAQDTVDVSGHIVSPGFIDLHTHSPTPLGQYYQAMDGTTTALELEAGAFPVAEYGSTIHEQPLINYGASTGYISIRALEKQGIKAPHHIAAPEPVGIKGYWTALKSLFTEQRQVFEEKATANERKALRALLGEGLRQGGIGIGLALDYISEGVDSAELRMIFEAAAAHNSVVFVHIRRGVNGDPGGLYEVMELAKKTGASLHICHLQHNAMRNTALFLNEIAKACQQGVDITTEILPYNAGSALISSAVFNRNWQEIFDITYEDVEWAATGERFTEETWRERKKNGPDGQVIHHYVKEDWTRRALVEPGVMIVSDLLPMLSEDKNVAPHNAVFTKVLARYVRDEPLLDMNTALAKMTLLPAKRLEKIAPAFKKKGRLQIGTDADITVFNPATIKDNATYANPYQTADGISYVIVNGTMIVRAGELVRGAYPGKEILSDHAFEEAQ